MSPIVKLIISLVISVIAYTLTSLLFTGTVQLTEGNYDLKLLFAFFFATATAALIVRDAQVEGPDQHHSDANNRPGLDAVNVEDSDDRSLGEVKWFNTTKGFGFIIMDDGEEIFVHYRSIRGEGRRSLKDGQRVSFQVAENEKGPQAEDVTPV